MVKLAFGGIAAKGVKRLDKAVATSFDRVREELLEHLDSINQNTAELDSVDQRIMLLEQMIDKLTERVDELAFSSTTTTSMEQFDVRLSLREQEVFVALYMSAEPLAPYSIAHYLGLTEELILAFVQKLISKGIPIHKKYQDNVLVYYLDKQFKDLQARKQLVTINDEVLEQFNLSDSNSF